MGSRGGRATRSRLYVFFIDTDNSAVSLLSDRNTVNTIHSIYVYAKMVMCSS